MKCRQYLATVLALAMAAGLTAGSPAAAYAETIPTEIAEEAVVTKAEEIIETEAETEEETAEEVILPETEAVPEEMVEEEEPVTVIPETEIRAEEAVWEAEEELVTEELDAANAGYQVVNLPLSTSYTVNYRTGSEQVYYCFTPAATSYYRFTVMQSSAELQPDPIISVTPYDGLDTSDTLAWIDDVYDSEGKLVSRYPDGAVMLEAGRKYCFDIYDYNHQHDGEAVTVFVEQTEIRIDTLNSRTDGVYLEWGHTAYFGEDGNMKYRIYRKTPGGKFTKIADLEPSVSCYTDTSAEDSETYIYTIRLLDPTSSKAVGDYDKTGSQITYYHTELQGTDNWIEPRPVSLKLNTEQKVASASTILNNGMTAYLFTPTKSSFYRFTCRKGQEYEGETYDPLVTILEKTDGCWVVIMNIDDTWDKTSETVVSREYDGAYYFQADQTYMMIFKDFADHVDYYYNTLVEYTPALPTLVPEYEGIQIKWTYYEYGLPNQMMRLYRKEGDGSYKKIADLDMNVFSYLDRNVTPGVTYTYTMRPFAAGEPIVGNYNKTGVSMTYAAQPGGFALANTMTGVKFTWKTCAGAAKYAVYRKEGTGSYKRLGTTTAASYVDTTAVSGKTYTYTARCLGTDGKFNSTYDSVGSSITFLSGIKVKAANSSAGMNLSWAKVAGADGYYVYRKTTGSFSKVETIQDGTVTSTRMVSLTNGTKYTLAVRPYKVVDGKTITGAYTAVTVVRLTTPAIGTMSTAATRRLTITTTKNAKATGYQFQYSKKSDCSSATTVTVSGAANTSKTVTVPSTGKYYVRVRSYVKDGSNYYSQWSAIRAITVSK